MAIELGRVNVNDLVENDYKVIGIGINRRSNTDGIFPVNYTTLTQAKDNLRNLIMTRRGERVMHPDFGCGIWDLVFSQMADEDLDYQVENTITEAVQKWLPYLTITELIIDAGIDNKDKNQFEVQIGFSLQSNSSIRDSITLNINQ